MVKLLMLITSLAGGGAEKVASELSLNLSQNIQRRIVTLTNEVSYPANVPPISMNFKFRQPKFLSMVYAMILGTIKYRRILNKYKPDVSLSFLVLDSFINVLSNIGNKKTKTIVSVHVALSMKFRNSLLDRFAKYLIKISYNKAALLIAVSEGVKKELIQDFNINQSKVKIISNPVDVERIEDLAREEVNDEWFNENLPIIINMGGLKRAKGQWHLIRAFSKVRKRKQCRLVICGDGVLKSYLEGLVSDLNLKNDVKFLGWKDNPFEYISKASVFAFSSLWEALPYALIEAMACGCPIIATDCKYGPREILVDGEYGILVPPMDGKFYKASNPLTPEEERLVHEIIKLLEDDKLRKGYAERAKERAMDFDVGKSMKQYEEVLISV